MKIKSAKPKEPREKPDLEAFAERLRATPGKRPNLAKIAPDGSPGFEGDKKAARRELRKLRSELFDFQTKLWAERKHSMLVVLQAMDAGGKDGTIRKVFAAFDPQGTQVTGFGVPTEEELAHDFLWRIHEHAPSDGRIGIFNRTPHETALPEAAGARRVPDPGLTVMTNWKRTVAGFSETAENYTQTMAPSLRTMAVRVVQRAELRFGDRILDAGTGTGIGAAAAMTAGREVVGVDGAAGMLAIARREVPGARFVEADYSELPFPSGSFDVVISVHALHFAVDPVATLAEWRRVTTAGGRLSLSVPGPRAVLSHGLYDPIYRRHGLLRRIEVPTRTKLLSWARAAGWRKAAVTADPETTVRLAGPDSFERWMKTGSRSVASRALSDERFAALSAALLAATPVGPDGLLHIPFGTLYLTARNP